MSGVYGYPNDPTATSGTVGTGGGAGGVIVDEGNTTVAALNNAQRGLAGDMGMYRNDTSGKQTTGGSANAYTVTLESVPTALADGLGFSAIIHASNTGATTINVNSLGAKKVLYKGVALSGGELVAGQPARFSYDASADSAAGGWLIENPVPVTATVSYSASEIANDSNVSGTNVDNALNTLKSDADALVAGVTTAYDTLAEVETKFGAIDASLGNKLETADVTGKQTVWVPAGAMMAAATSGAESADNEAVAHDINYRTLAFDDAADEFAHFNIAMPKGWNEGTITFRTFWSTTATDTDGVAWGLQAVAVSDGGAIDASWGTAVVVTDDAQSAAGDVLVTAESGAVTIAGTPAEGDLCFFRVFRDVSDANDVMTEDALLIGIQLLYTTNALTDA